MKERNTILRDNLRRLYLVDLISIINVVVMLIPIVNILSVPASIIVLIMEITALSRLRDAHEDYASAFAAAVVALVAGLFSGGNGLLALLLKITESIATYVQLHFFFRATNELLHEAKADELESQGHRAWGFTIALVALSLLSSLVDVIPSIIVTIVAFIVVLIRMSFYKKASEFFGRLTVTDTP